MKDHTDSKQRPGSWTLACVRRTPGAFVPKPEASLMIQAGLSMDGRKLWAGIQRLRASRATILSVSPEGLPLGGVAQVPGRPVLPQAAQGLGPFTSGTATSTAVVPWTSRHQDWGGSSPSLLPFSSPTSPTKPTPHPTQDLWPRPLPLCRPWLKGWLSAGPPPDPDQDTGPA